MFNEMLIESAGTDRKKGGWITALISVVIHAGIITAIVAASLYVKENPEVIEKPMSAFIVSAPAPPPPPPPPAAESSAVTQPRQEEPEQQPEEEFQQPTETPEEVPQVPQTSSTTQPSTSGGVVGGVEGGVIGGVVGGTLGGVIGGELGGQLGGELGGTGDSPVRVGGNVKAPVVVSRVEPEYSEVARKARIEGVVIIEAVIDRRGNVTEARILKSLPMGLDEEALRAIRQWKFKPGTLNGQPVPVYYNLTVNFRLNQ